MISAKFTPETKIESETTPQEEYLREVCAFAIALHRETGLCLVELVQGNTTRYVGVHGPSGKLYGIHGVYTDKECCLKFFTSPPHQFLLTTEKMLREVIAVTDEEIRNALQPTRRIWPELPWK